MQKKVGYIAAGLIGAIMLTAPALAAGDLPKCSEIDGIVEFIIRWFFGACRL